MRAGLAYVHHNLLYDRGNKVTDRHAGIRALLADSGGAAEVAYNSLRRFRQIGIDGAASVHDNELYCDSFVTNSFALSAGDNAVIKNNRIFGMGYHPVGIGWGSNIHVKDNFIYLWGYAPTRRDPEYERNSSISGMRVTNYYAETTALHDMLFEGNYIVLKATDNCTLARGIWTVNSLRDSNILYRHNTVKVEAMPGNYVDKYNEFSDYYYNGDVNSVIAAVTVQGNGWDSEDIPDALVFEDNRLISNVNHIVIGEGYGITSGVRFYRTTLEKIDHDIGRFYAPLRLGFWYWNTLKNRIIDTKFAGVTEEEMTPYFYGGAGKMEVFYGERKTFLFIDGDGLPLANKTITLATENSGIVQTRQTNAEGEASFDMVSAGHFKYGNSLENGGKAGEPGRSEYGRHIFSARGYNSYLYPSAP
jgi:hypothetical protein